MISEEDRINIINRYKRKSDNDYLVLIPINDKFCHTIGFLRPITTDYNRSLPTCVSLLGKWRKENPSLSPARFEISDERTDSWLQKLVINNNNRIIFLIQDVSGTNIGHIGLAGFRHDEAIAEVDSVLRGEKNVYPQMMEYSMNALLNWGKSVLSIQHFDLEVIWNNEHAIHFYERCGFVKDYLIPLRKEVLPNEVKWVVDYELGQTAELYYQHMTLKEDSI